jgi:HK97 family phage major capsid protein
MELLRDSSPAADGLIRTELGRAVRERLDIDFIDPGKAAVANVSPASILNGISAIPSSGSDAEDIRADIRTLFGTFIAANNAPTNGVWIMGAETALALSLLQNPLGQAEFPGVGMTGGTLFGLPVVVSQYAVRDTEGAVVALVNASDIWVADEGGLEVRASNEASIEMDNAPTNASAPSGAVVEQTLVSMFQTNSVAFLAERTMNWARARASAVAYMTGVTWGEAS